MPIFHAQVAKEVTSADTPMGVEDEPNFDMAMKKKAKKKKEVLAELLDDVAPQAGKRNIRFSTFYVILCMYVFRVVLNYQWFS